MLRIIRSNAVESLLDQLARHLGEAPPSSPLVPETVVVPSPAMGRWVNLQLARCHGVAANLAYPLPASFVWDLSTRLLDDLPETDPLRLDAMTWKVFALLPPMLREPGFEPLYHYLSQDHKGVKRWQLARRIADVLDRYQLYRPERIRAWGQGGEGDWQAQLWRALTGDVQGRHRVAVIDRLLAALSGRGPFPSLPERTSLFAISSLPPLFVEVFRALSTHTRVDLYLHAPTDAFWADLIPQKALARKRLRQPEEADLWEVGNSLLASWGRQGQALHDLLLAREMAMEEVDAFAEPSTDRLLTRLQRDIFTLKPIAAGGARVAIPTDDSLQVHVCHSPLRECQVLHDQLLALLEADPRLRPEEVLVMIPEISLYASYVEAVFDRDAEGGHHAIPWNLSDISETDEHPLVRVFLQLLGLHDSRFGHSEILSFLDVPELAAHFGLDGDGVSQVKAWLAQANLRWGLNAAHKQRLGLPAVEENTWAQAEKRLFGGYALGETALFDGIAPVASVEGGKAEALGRFWRLLSKLAEAADWLAAPRTSEAWQTGILGMLTDFFGERDDEDGRLQRIREAVSDLVEEAGGFAEGLSPVLVRLWLEDRLGGEGRRGRYFSGGVTFCGMRPMRSLPFKVICVLGLQDQAFPRRDRLAEFDLMRRDWRPGDPRKGDEDRYLFLETLLCARQRLYLSYVGRDIRRNVERQPSVLVRELLDYLDQQYVAAGGEEGDKLSDRLTTVHPLQPFSARNFSGGRRGYDDFWCEVSRAMARPVPREAEAPSSWAGARLSEAPRAMRDVTLVQLERFVRHPVKYFVNSRLHVYFEEEVPAEDDEPFALDGLQSFLLKQRLVQDHLEIRGVSRRQLSAEGALPHGAFAELVLEEERGKVASLVERLEVFRHERPGRISIDLVFDGRSGPQRLTGEVDGIYPRLGLLKWKPGALRGADVLGLWLAHLAWCAGDGCGAKCSTLETADGRFVIGEALAPELARSMLDGYLGWYWEGVHRPLALFPKASYAYAVRARRGGGADPLKAARSEWEGNAFRGVPGEKDDPYVQLVTRRVAGLPLLSPEFPRLASAFYDQALVRGEQV
jgi:exodeoxyribonuclease V gamma subunit